MTEAKTTDCVACEHPVSIPEDLQGTVSELHTCGGSWESQIRAWQTESETCIVWGTHEPEPASAVWAKEFGSFEDDDDMPDWENAIRQWADPAELDKDEDEPWEHMADTQQHPHWVPFLAVFY